MSVRRLAHVSVTVADMDRSVAFWCDVLGLPLAGRGVVEYPHLDEIVGLADTRIEWAEIEVPGGGVIELFRYHRPDAEPVPASEPNQPGATHVCLEVDDLDALVTRVQAAGVATRSAAPVRIPSGDWEGWRDIYVVSPDGIIVELSEPPAS